MSVNKHVQKLFSQSLDNVSCVVFAPYIQDDTHISGNTCVFGITSDVVASGAVLKFKGLNLIKPPSGLGSIQCKGAFGFHGMRCILAAINESRISMMKGGQTYVVHSYPK